MLHCAFWYVHDDLVREARYDRRLTLISGGNLVLETTNYLCRVVSMELYGLGVEAVRGAVEYGYSVHYDLWISAG